jgi:hypothetical protein
MSAKSHIRRGIGTGGAVFLIVALLMVAMSAYIILVPVDPNNFEATTGSSWAAFSSSNPEAAEYLEREARLLAVGFLGLSLLAAAVAWGRFQGDDRSAIGPLWLFPLALLGAGVVFISGGGVALGSAYLVAGVVAALGLGLAVRRKLAG